MKRKSFIAIIAAMALLSGCAAQENSSYVDSISGTSDGTHAPSDTTAGASVPGTTAPPDSAVSSTPPDTASGDDGTISFVESSKTDSETSAPSTTVPPAIEKPSYTGSEGGESVPSVTAAPDKHSDPAGTDYKATDIGGTGTTGDSDGYLYDAIAESAVDAADAAYGTPTVSGAADEEAYLTAPDSYCPEPYDPYIEPQIPPAAGLLTGGEWNDNENWDFWQGLYESANYSVDWEEYKTTWRTGADFRLEVTVKDSAGSLVSGARVSTDQPKYSAVTDNEGKAYLFYSEDQIINGPSEITVSFGDYTQTGELIISGDDVFEITLDCEVQPPEKTLDFMIMCDTTGSMWDELDYLKAELEDVVTRIKQENANIPTRLSVNFYRDEGDEYVVREFPFTTDLDAAVNAIAQQSADGGGDTPEAVHTALNSAINNHDWDENSVKIMFLVLDAPPHNDIQIIDETIKLVNAAAEKGIRIIPVASSGIDKSCEYLLRSMAFMTGGTYAFLTNDSGIGGYHIEPTIGSYDVEKLNDMMVRIVGEYLA